MAISVTADTVTDELTWASAHNCATGDMVSFSAGTMPAPLVYGTTYYAIVSSGTVMKVATTRANALASTAIDLTTAGATILGTKDTGRIGEVNLPIQDGSRFVKLSNVPLPVGVLLTNIVNGSRVRVSKASDNSELYLGTPGTLASFATKFTGNVIVDVRKKGYIPYRQAAIITSDGLDLYVSQVADTVVV